MKSSKNKIIIAIVVCAILAIAFFYEGGTSKPTSELANKQEIVQLIDEGNDTANDLSSNKAEVSNINDETTVGGKHEAVSTTDPNVKDNIDQTSNIASDKSNEILVTSNELANTNTEEPINANSTANNAEAKTSNNIATVPPKQEGKENIEKEPEELTCTISIDCSTILNNMDMLLEDKVSVVPSDGVILAEQTVDFTEGESVFDVLLRVTKENKIHMEFMNTPIYKTAYLEGIGNIYEFDCGELSGWQYRVNGVFPSYGCSRYILQPGDKIEWVYTCDLGKDVGGTQEFVEE